VSSWFGYLVRNLLKKEKDWEKEEDFKELLDLEMKAKQHRLYMEKDYPEYETCANHFNYCVKNNLLNRNLIIGFRKLVDKHLGDYTDNYRNYKFKNDIHEIKVKLKDEGLLRFDFQELDRFLNIVDGGKFKDLHEKEHGSAPQYTIDTHYTETKEIKVDYEYTTTHNPEITLQKQK
jgi:hypothetical protein